MGSSWARVKGTGAAGRRSRSSATSTRSASIVTHIDDEGSLGFRGVGGWDPQILVGRRVEARHA